MVCALKSETHLFLSRRERVLGLVTLEVLVSGRARGAAWLKPDPPANSPHSSCCKYRMTLSTLQCTDVVGSMATCQATIQHMRAILIPSVPRCFDITSYTPTRNALHINACSVQVFLLLPLVRLLRRALLLFNALMTNSAHGSLNRPSPDIQLSFHLTVLHAEQSMNLPGSFLLDRVVPTSRVYFFACAKFHNKQGKPRAWSVPNSMQIALV